MEREAQAFIGGKQDTVEVTTAAEKQTSKRKQTLKRAKEALNGDDRAQTGLKLRRQESLERVAVLVTRHSIIQAQSI